VSRAKRGMSVRQGTVDPPPQAALPVIAGAQEDGGETDAERNAAAGLPADTVWAWFPGPNDVGDGPWQPNAAWMGGWRPK
jgi:hypothetical protein